MEIPRRLEETQSVIDSPNNNGLIMQIQTPPLTPTTFVQADTSSFKQVVQILTGSSETTSKQQAAGRPNNSDPPPFRNYNIPPIKKDQKKQGFKLYERRNSLKMISPLIPNLGHNSSGYSPRKHLPFPEILSPSMLDFPSLALSPVTPLIEDPFNKSSPSLGSSSEEDRAIAEKGFYLHPSPRTMTPRDSEPRLLPLFPVTSPRVSGSTSR
ncbi:VQ motif-containing protein 4-like [Impatiens glandulifera]|uniref:VQ motif-containing protein 4-like n=1 Tax=Impatiens glandulifera TaxID=253017 RepID=UPI001FB0E5B4|nr:VQ motif-containing protein 4-like [Impatiens glandulifera]